MHYYQVRCFCGRGPAIFFCPLLSAYTVLARLICNKIVKKLGKYAKVLAFLLFMAIIIIVISTRVN